MDAALTFAGISSACAARCNYSAAGYLLWQIPLVCLIDLQPFGVGPLGDLEGLVEVAAEAPHGSILAVYAADRGANHFEADAGAVLGHIDDCRVMQRSLWHTGFKCAVRKVGPIRVLGE